MVCTTLERFERIGPRNKNHCQVHVGWLERFGRIDPRKNNLRQGQMRCRCPLWLQNQPPRIPTRGRLITVRSNRPLLDPNKSSSVAPPADSSSAATVLDLSSADLIKCSTSTAVSVSSSSSKAAAVATVLDLSSDDLVKCSTSTAAAAKTQQC